MQRRMLFKSAVLPAAGMAVGKTVAAAEGPVEAAEEIVADVAIAGAGFAGLTAAVTAARTGAKVVLLERRAYHGGDGILSVGILASSRSKVHDALGFKGKADLEDYWSAIDRGMTDEPLAKVRDNMPNSPIYGGFVNNPRLKSKTLQLLPRQRRIRPVYVRPLSHQPVTQTLQISTCIEVAVRTVTTVAFEPVLFTLSNGTACRTGLACVFGVNKHHADADTTGFVDDHLLKLAERPTVQPGTNSESRPDPFPDMGKIFQDDQSFSLRLSFFYDLFADHVIHLFHMSSFSARDSFQRAFGVSRTIALKTSSVTQKLVAVIL